MRTVITLLVIAFVTKTATAQPTRPDRIERVVAVVDNAVILQSELDARLDPASLADPLARQRVLAQTLDQMIDEELVVSAAATARIQVSDAEVDAAIADIKHANDLDDDGLARALDAQGYTAALYRESLRRQLVRIRAIDQQVAPKVQVTEESVRSYYDELQRKSATPLAPYEQLHSKLANELRHRELDRRVAAWVAELRRRAHVEIKLEP